MARVTRFCFDPDFHGAFFHKNENWNLERPRGFSVYWVQSQLKMSIPDYWGQGISIDTHIAKVCGKSEKGTLALPWCP